MRRSGVGAVLPDLLVVINNTNNSLAHARAEHDHHLLKRCSWTRSDFAHKLWRVPDMAIRLARNAVKHMRDLFAGIRCYMSFTRATQLLMGVQDLTFPKDDVTAASTTETICALIALRMAPIFWSTRVWSGNPFMGACPAWTSFMFKLVFYLSTSGFSSSPWLQLQPMAPGKPLAGRLLQVVGVRQSCM